MARKKYLRRVVISPDIVEMPRYVRFEIQPESLFATNVFLYGRPVYRDSGRPLGPEDKNRWERSWADGFFTRGALYRLKGLKPQPDTPYRAYIANTKGRLTGLFHVADGLPVKRHLKRGENRLPCLASCEPVIAEPYQPPNEALLAKLRAVGEFLAEQDRIWKRERQQRCKR